jgi:hypothetical protein
LGQWNLTWGCCWAAGSMAANEAGLGCAPPYMLLRARSCDRKLGHVTDDVMQFFLNFVTSLYSHRLFTIHDYNTTT